MKFMFTLNQNLIENLYSWIIHSGLKILAVIIVAFLIHKFGKIFIEKGIRKFIRPDRYATEEAERKRENTLINIINGTLGVVIMVISIIIILEEVGVPIAPLLTTAGIVGVAVGFGAQYLIRDIISGLFIILENQYRINDVVCFDKTCGVVEEISLRTTSVRDMDGTVHHIPHGEVKKVSNLTKTYSRVNLNIGIAYDSDLEKVIQVINQVGQDLANDPVWSESIIKAPEFLRIDDFADSAIIVKILGDTKPTKQWAVTGELRKRLKLAFDKEGIEIPFPQRVIYTKN